MVNRRKAWLGSAGARTWFSEPTLAGLGILLPAAAADFFGLVAGMSGSRIRWKDEPVAAEEGGGDAGRL